MRAMTVGKVIVDTSDVASFIQDAVEGLTDRVLDYQELIHMVEGVLDNEIYWHKTPGLMKCPLELLLKSYKVDVYEISLVVKRVRDMLSPIICKCHDAIDDFGDMFPDHEDYRVFLETEGMRSLTACIRLELIEPPALDHDIVTEEAWDGCYI